MSSLPEVTPIIVASLTARCGTNWVANTLKLHPQCSRSSSPSLGEDWYALPSQHLVKYVDALAIWGYGWETPADAWETVHYACDQPDLLAARKSALLCDFGRTLLRFSRPWPAGRKYLVLKQPSLQGLEHAARLFPAARCVVLVRELCAVAESTWRTWDEGEAPERSNVLRSWCEGVRQLRALQARPPLPLLAVKYEQLVAEPVRKFSQILRFLDLPAEDLDLAAAAAVVHGSSDSRFKTGTMEWTGRPREADFNPLERAAGWTPEQRATFVAEAHPELRYLGYAP